MSLIRVGHYGFAAMDTADVCDGITVVGVVFGDFVGDAIERTRAATRTAHTTWVSAGSHR